MGRHHRLGFEDGQRLGHANIGRAAVGSTSLVCVHACVRVRVLGLGVGVLGASSAQHDRTAGADIIVWTMVNMGQGVVCKW